MGKRGFPIETLTNAYLYRERGRHERIANEFNSVINIFTIVCARTTARQGQLIEVFRRKYNYLNVVIVGWYKLKI